MLRSAFLWLSERRGVFNFVKRNGLARQFARRFVAGESVEDAITSAHALNAKGIAVSLDLLGESVKNREEAIAARDAALALFDHIHEHGIHGNVSIKLTQMGLDLDPALAVENATRIAERAKAHGTFVRIDMEASSYVTPTLELFGEHLHPRFGDAIGVVIQSMLRRSAGDIEDLIRRRARVRLVKGAYAESPAVAFPDKRDVDENFKRLTERLLCEGQFPAIATHDERLIAHARTVATRERLDPARFEFQLLYGVRRDLQDRLRHDGYTVRVYVPFGTEWYPYLMRRLAERPANVAFIVGSVVKERFARS